MDYPKVGTLFNYIGGKSWLKENLRKEVNTILSQKKLSSYVEPFCGGLGAFLGVYDVLHDHGIKKVYLGDVNTELIDFYETVKSSPKELINQYMLIEQEYVATIPAAAYQLHKTREKEALKLLLKETENYFKKIRQEYNELKKKNKDKLTDRLNFSAHLLFLQNHCFNGVYRENSRGDYNTPFNWEPKSFTEEKISEKINTVNWVFSLFELTFVNQSFEKFDYNQDTLYYLDPPYLNEQEEVQENKYHKEGFGIQAQKNLIEKIMPTSFIYSNHKTRFLIEEFNRYSGQHKRIIHEIPRKNIISASIESRKVDKIEILVTQIEAAPA